MADRRDPVSLNDIASIATEVIMREWTINFVPLRVRYGIAEAVWDAGYRRSESGSSEEGGD